MFLLETGSVGRILSEVAAQAAGDRVRKARLLPGAAQAALLGRIGDIGGLDEHGGNIAGLEHHEAGALHLRLAYLAHPLERAHHPLRCAGTDADDLVLRRIDEHRLESALVVAARARGEIRGVLTLGEPAGRFARGAVHRQHVDRGARDTTVADRVGVHRNEHVGVRGVRAPDALAQLEKFIAIARQHGPHAGFGVDALGESPRDGKRHVLLAGAAAADSPGILAPVSRIHRDDHVAVALPGCVRRAHRLRWRLRRGRRLPECEDQPVALLLRRPAAMRG